MKTAQKEFKLEKILRNAGKAIIAFSGGTDSTFLLKKAVDVLGADSLLAVTAKSQLNTVEEINNAVKTAGELEAAHLVLNRDVLANPLIAANGLNRCYHCKKELMQKMLEIAGDENIGYIADGSNYSDKGDFRPGSKAVEEMGGHSPLMEAGLTKEEIRRLSKKANLSTWNKKSNSCLATRFPYDKPLTAKELKLVADSEKSIKNLGINSVRVRLQPDSARIEVEEQDLAVLMAKKERVTAELRDLGFLYVTLDLEGYRSGSMDKRVNA